MIVLHSQSCKQEEGLVALDDLLKKGREVCGTTLGPWSKGKEPGFAESSMTGSKDTKSGMTESSMTGIEKSKGWSET